MRMRHVVICGLSRRIIFFSHYLTNWIIFEKKVMDILVLIFYDFFLETFLILCRTERDMIKTVYWPSCKVPASCPILMKLEFSDRYSDIKFYENPFSGRRIVPCGRENRRKDGQTNMTALTVAFRSFANASKTSTEQSLPSGASFRSTNQELNLCNLPSSSRKVQ
jgi:hypothetical protein